MFIDYIDTPLGLMECKASEKGLRHLIFCGESFSDITQHTISNEHIQLCKNQLTQYFAGQRKAFDLPLDPQGSEFQKKVWQQLSAISFGELATYLDIAKRVNKPRGSQAVGGANGRNPLTIIVPCHRVIGSNGSLTGYAGGLARKRWLLHHEGANIPHDSSSSLSEIEEVKKQRQAKTQFLR